MMERQVDVRVLLTVTIDDDDLSGPDCEREAARRVKDALKDVGGDVTIDYAAYVG